MQDFSKANFHHNTFENIYIYIAKPKPLSKSYILQWIMEYHVTQPRLSPNEINHICTSKYPINISAPKIKICLDEFNPSLKMISSKQWD